MLIILIALTMTASAVKPYYNTDYASAPAMNASAGHDSAGAVSGRLTAGSANVGLPNAYIAIVNASNTSQAFYQGNSDPYGFYQFPVVNNTWVYDPENGAVSSPGVYKNLYKVYANHSLIGEGFSSSFAVEDMSTAPANVYLITIPANIQLSANRSYLIANGSDYLTVSAYVTDILGEPVVDGMCIDFRANNGSSYNPDYSGRWNPDTPQYIHVYTTNGYANATFGWISGDSMANDVTLSAVSAYCDNNEVNDSISIAIQSATDPILEWGKTYGGPGPQTGSSLAQTGDGFIIAGYTSIDDIEQDVCLIKTDFDGDVIWNKTYNRTGDEAGLSVIATSDGYTIAGSISNNSYSDVYLVKTNLNGDFIWGKMYGGYATDLGSSLIATSDGYLICGYTNSFGNGSYDIYLIKTDFDGNYVWGKTYGGSGVDYGWSVISVSDGYAITGSTSSSGSGNDDVYFIKTDLNGNVQWSKTYGGTGWESGHSVVATGDGYLIAGEKGGAASPSDDSYDVYLLKTDMNGNEIWTKTYGGTRRDVGREVFAVDDGYVVAGSSLSFSPDYGDIYLFKTDFNGNLIWQMTSGGPYWDRCGSAARAGNSYLIIGYSNSYSSDGYTDVYLVRVTDPCINSAPLRPTSTTPAPSMWGNGNTYYQHTGSVSGRVTTANTSIAIPNAYVAIVNASNVKQAYYVGQADANGFFQFPAVNNTYDGSIYQWRYKVYADHSQVGFGYSNSFPVEPDSTAPANCVILQSYDPLPTPTPTVLHYPNRDIQVVPAPAMGSSQHAGAISGKLTTQNTSYGLPYADVLILNATNTSQAFYVGKTDSQGYFQFTGVNTTYGGTPGTYATRYKVYAYSSTFGEGYSNAFPVEPYSTAQANVVIIPPPAHIYIFVDKYKLAANGSDTLILSAYVADIEGNPVADGTLVDLIINNNSTYDATRMGHWGQSSGQQITRWTTNGYVQVTFGWIPADSTENRVTLSAVSAAGSASPANKSVNITVLHDLSNIEWIRTINGTPLKAGSSVAELSDGYVIAGTAGSPADIYLARTDIAGNLIWEKTIGTANEDQGFSVAAVRDGFVVVGLTDQPSGYPDVYLIKTDLDGNLIWEKTYGGLSADVGRSVVAVSDGYVLTGLTFSLGDGSGDVYIIKTDLDGNLIWEKAYGGAGWQGGYSIAAVSDGYVITGDTVQAGHSDLDIYLLKIDKGGNLLWDNVFGGGNTDIGQSITTASDGYLIAGSTVSYSDRSYSSGSPDVYLIKTDLDGNKLWQKTYGGAGSDTGYSIARDLDGYILVGSTYLDGGGDVYLIKTDMAGNLVWQELLGDCRDYSQSSVIVTEDGYVVAGYTYSAGSPQYDTFIAKVNRTPMSATPSIIPYTLKLYPGWNLVSIPVELQDNDLSSIFPADVKSNIINIWGWDEAEQNWVYYAPDQEDYFYDYYPALTGLETGKAYWVEMSQPATVTLQGTVPAYAPDSPTSLHSGWNFVGSTGMSSPLIASMYPNAVSVWGWDEVEQNWVYYSTVDDYFYSYYPELNNACPGDGYWVEIA